MWNKNVPHKNGQHFLLTSRYHGPIAAPLLARAGPIAGQRPHRHYPTMQGSLPIAGQRPQRHSPTMQGSKLPIAGQRQPHKGRALQETTWQKFCDGLL